MTGNATHRFTNTAILSVCAIDAPQVVTSAEIDARLADTYTRVGLRPGMMQRLAGIEERRWWEVYFELSAGTLEQEERKGRRRK